MLRPILPAAGLPNSVQVNERARDGLVRQPHEASDVRAHYHVPLRYRRSGCA